MTTKILIKIINTEKTTVYYRKLQHFTLRSLDLKVKVIQK